MKGCEFRLNLKSWIQPVLEFEGYRLFSQQKYSILVSDTRDWKTNFSNSREKLACDHFSTCWKYGHSLIWNGVNKVWNFGIDLWNSEFQNWAEEFSYQLGVNSIFYYSILVSLEKSV